MVDEFAALVQEVPEFVDGVVNVAQRGRSLGLHLILATQRPAGVIKDNLRANTNLRIALRMADEADSDDVLGTPVAAYFDPALPGRAVSKTGPGRLTPFQTGYAGGWTTGERAAGLAGRRDPRLRRRHARGSCPVVEERTRSCRRTSAPPTSSASSPRSARRQESAEIPDPRKPWLPELAPVYDLADLPTRRRDDELVFGVSDDPDSQTQPPIASAPTSRATSPSSAPRVGQERVPAHHRRRGGLHRPRRAVPRLRPGLRQPRPGDARAAAPRRERHQRPATTSASCGC